MPSPATGSVPMRAAKAVGAAHYDNAGRKSFDVPLPRTWQRFIKVIDVKNEVALGRSIGAEVTKMSIARYLGADTGRRSRTQVGGHNRG
jgi:hypothetical protein